MLNSLTGVALCGWAGFVDTFWITDGSAEIQNIYNTGFRRVSIPFFMFDPENQAITRLVSAVATAVGLGMQVRIPFHIDGYNQVNANVPFLEPVKYLRAFEDAISALATGIPTNEYHLITIEVGNEVVGPEENGSPTHGWENIRTLYSLFHQCAQFAKATLPNCRVVVPAPYDQQMYWLWAGMQNDNLPKSIVVGVTAKSIWDALAVHYPFETINEVNEIPGVNSYTVPELLAEAHHFYGLPIEISEFWGDSQLNVNAIITSTIAYCNSTSTIVDCWQWEDPSVPQIKNNQSVLQLLGVGAT